MDSQLESLERQFCPPIDSSTFYAIISDFDVSNPRALGDAHDILGKIKASAEAEEATGFDPSGSSNLRDANSDHEGAIFSNSEDIVSSETSLTDATNSLSAFTFDDGTGSPYDGGIDAMSLDEKKALLQEMFADMRAFDIEFILQKQKGDFGSAVEELLSRKFLADGVGADGQSYHVPRGIDGFATDGAQVRPRKGRSKRKQKQLATLEVKSVFSEGQANSANRWHQAKDHVEFISTRTGLSSTFVSSVYNQSGHSIRQTMIKICKTDVNDLGCDTDANDPQIQSNVVDLSVEFPALPLQYLTVLALLTHPLMLAARELAAAMSSSGERIVPQYVSTKVEDHEALLPEDRNPYHLEPLQLPVGAQLDTLRSRAFAQASAAFRQSKSNPLMGGAAAHYASMGHAANAAMKRERALQANARVNSQSSPESCDLHGVTVSDAVRIAKQYVERWWETRREYAREGKAVGSGEFRVVTGRGAHSAEGKGKLGPAVAKMLRTEGWRVDEQVGELIVRGRQRK